LKLFELGRGVEVVLSGELEVPQELWIHTPRAQRRPRLLDPITVILSVLVVIGMILGLGHGSGKLVFFEKL